MPSAPRSRADLVDVLLAHKLSPEAELEPLGGYCSCFAVGRSGFFMTYLEHADHVAGALAAAAAAPARRVLPANLRVLVLLAEARGEGLTDTQLARRWAVKVARPRNSWPPISDSGLRTRRSELVHWGLAEEVPGSRGRTLANRPTRLWRLADPSDAGVPVFELEAIDAYEQLYLEADVDVVTQAALLAAHRAQGKARRS